MTRPLSTAPTAPLAPFDYDPHPPDWMRSALCAQVGDPDQFFPPKSGRRQAAAAQAICHACPVIDDCLVYALVNHEPFGVWGGATERQRRRITQAGTSEHDRVEIARRRRVAT